MRNRRQSTRNTTWLAGLMITLVYLAQPGCNGDQTDPKSIPKIPPGSKQMPTPGDENGVGKSAGGVIPVAPPRR